VVHGVSREKLGKGSKKEQKTMHNVNKKSTSPNMNHGSDHAPHQHEKNTALTVTATSGGAHALRGVRDTNDG
jgi:hypothetical protein